METNQQQTSNAMELTMTKEQAINHIMQKNPGMKYVQAKVYVETVLGL